MLLCLPQWLRAFVVIALLYSAAAQQENDGYLRGLNGLYHELDDLDLTYNSIAQQAPQRLRLLPISDNVTSNGYDKLQIWDGSTGSASGSAKVAYIMCQQHAREVIAAEYCYWLVRLLTDTNTTTLLEWPEFQSQLGSTARFKSQGAERVSAGQLAAWVREIVAKVEVQVIPVVNRVGAQLVQSGRFALRKTPDTQVDLNRNWPGTFSTAASDPEANPSAETYRGPAALSEWQTRTIHNDLMVVRPAVLLDIHSGIWSLLAPWASKFTVSDIPEAHLAYWQSLLSAATAHTTVAAGPSAPLLYAAKGGATDSYLTFNKEATPFTFEIHGAASEADGRDVQCPTLAEFNAACTTSGCGNVKCYKQTANGGIKVFDPQAAALANTLSANSVFASPGQAAADMVAAATAAARTRGGAGVPRAGRKLLQLRALAAALVSSGSNASDAGGQDKAPAVSDTATSQDAQATAAANPVSSGSSMVSSQTGGLRLESAMADSSAAAPPLASIRRRPPPRGGRRSSAPQQAPWPAATAAAAAAAGQGGGQNAAAAGGSEGAGAQQLQVASTPPPLAPPAAAPPPPPVQSSPPTPAAPAAQPPGLVPSTARAAGAAAEQSSTQRSKSYVQMDPFMKNLQSSKEAYFWYYFNPSTPDTYRDVIARWMVATLVMLDAL